MTARESEPLSFGSLGRRAAVASFDGGLISSDGGALLLREVDTHIGLIDRFAGGFIRGHASLIEHSLRQLLAQRVFGLALGYEDLNDHDAQRRDPVLAAVLG